MKILRSNSVMRKEFFYLRVKPFLPDKKAQRRNVLLALFTLVCLRLIIYAAHYQYSDWAFALHL